MLVLSRKKRQDIVIRVGEVEIVITLCDIRGDKVRIGVLAPEHVTVHRKEVQDAIDKQGIK